MVSDSVKFRRVPADLAATKIAGNRTCVRLGVVAKNIEALAWLPRLNTVETQKRAQSLGFAGLLKENVKSRTVSMA